MFSKPGNSEKGEFEVSMAIMGSEVSFRHVACEISVDYLVEVFSKWFEFKRKDSAGDVRR